MNNVEYECIKGIIFFRFKEPFDKYNVEKNYKGISRMIEDSKITNVVFNLKDVDYIDNEGINFLNYNYRLCKKNNGKILFCDVSDKIREKMIYNYLPITSNELTALNYFNI